jgi:hypothetical protein
MGRWRTAGLLLSVAWIQSARGQQIAVTVDAGRLTARFQGQPLQLVSEQLKASTLVGIVPAEGLDGDLISADLNGVALEEGLRSLFSGYDTFFFYDSSKTVPAALKTVWIYPKGTASGLRPVRPAEWAMIKDLEAAVSDADARVRESAYDALLERPDQRSRRLVIDALSGTREQDAALRERLLSNAIRKGFSVPGEILSDLARTGQSEQIRWIALDALSETPLAKQAAQAAMTDASEAVRSRAKDILAEQERP